MLRASDNAGLALSDVPGYLEAPGVFPGQRPFQHDRRGLVDSRLAHCARVHSFPPTCISTVPRAPMQEERCSSLADVLGDHPRGSLWGLFWPGVTVGGAKRWNKPAPARRLAHDRCADCVATRRGPVSCDRHSCGRNRSGVEPESILRIADFTGGQPRFDGWQVRVGRTPGGFVSQCRSP